MGGMAGATNEGYTRTDAKTPVNLRISQESYYDDDTVNHWVNFWNRSHGQTRQSLHVAVFGQKGP